MCKVCYKCNEPLSKAEIQKGNELCDEYDMYSPDLFICFFCDGEYLNNEPDYPEYSDADNGL